ncbi:MAG: hypothetical protein JOY89_11810 [Solirubrobacterales bacterium]|nr:hypothetical protein [Solirubrobacterales bacterium]
MCRRQEGIETFTGLFLTAGDEVAVAVPRLADIAVARPGRDPLPVETGRDEVRDRAPKSIERLRGILFRHAVWRHAGKSNGVHYICGHEDGLKRIRKAANTGRAFRYDDLGLTLILLDTIKQQAIEMREADPTAVGVHRPAA